MRTRVLAGLAVGAVVVCVTASERARTRAASLLHQAWERSLVAAQTLIRGVDPLTTREAATAPSESPAEPGSTDVSRAASAEPDGYPAAAPEPEPEPVVVAVSEPIAGPVVLDLVTSRTSGGDGRARQRFAIASAAAAIVFAFVAAGAASWQQWRPGNHHSSPSQAAKSALPQALSTLVSQPGALRLPLIRSPGSLTVVVGKSDHAVLVGSNVAAAPTGEQYEIWVIRAGEAHRAGLYSGGTAPIAVALSRELPAGATVAVTLEPRGGVDSPTGKPLFHATRSLPRAVLDVLAQRDALRLPLSFSQGRLSIVVGLRSRAILISSKMPAAPAGKQYEVWVIRGQRPEPAGLFVGGSGRDVIALSRTVPPGATVAVTLERRGGVAAPTSKPRFSAKRS